MAGGHRLDGDKSKWKRKSDKRDNFKWWSGKPPARLCHFTKIWNGERRNTQAKNVQALGTACHGPEGDRPC